MTKLRSWFHHLVRRWLFRLFIATQPARGRVNVTDGVNPVALLNWLSNMPEHIGAGQEPLPLTVLQVRVAGLPERRALQVLLSPAQVKQLCELGLEAVERQRAAFGDERPREFDTGNVKAV